MIALLSLKIWNIVKNTHFEINKKSRYALNKLKKFIIH